MDVMAHLLSFLDTVSIEEEYFVRMNWQEL